MKLTVIGTGFVGVVTAGVFASFGHEVFGLDVDKEKVALLNKGVIPFFEPGLLELIQEQLKAKRVHFTTSYELAIQDSQVIFVAVGTPSTSDGQADLKYLFRAVESLAKYVDPEAVVVIKSTVPPGTNKKIEDEVKKRTPNKVFVASMPEFLREGSAVNDTLHPDRIVIGAKEPNTIAMLKNLHQPFQAPIFVMSPESAQMTKYSSNAYLANRITFINQIADLCEKNQADVQEVIQALGADQRIGSHYWYPGLGYGGSCFPKDVKELAAYSRTVGEGDNLFNKLDELNESRPEKLMQRFSEVVGGWENKKVAVLGLSFKPNTDDTREAPSLRIVRYLLEKEATVLGYDPRASIRALITEEGYTEVKSIDDGILGVDVIIATVEWPQITQFDFPTVTESHQVYFIDVRNQFDRAMMKKKGYDFIGVGR